MELQSANPIGGIITALKAQRRNAERANLEVDGSFVCGVAWEVVLAEGLRVGAALDAAALRRLQAADEQWRAKDAALGASFMTVCSAKVFRRTPRSGRWLR
jgi:hypothetical protein